MSLQRSLLSFSSTSVLLAFLAACGGSSAGGGTGPGPTPSILTVSPSTGTVGTELKVDGSNFRTAAQVLLGSQTSDSVDVASGTELFAIVPSGISAGDTLSVTVRNADGTSAVLDSAFVAVAPRLDFVNGATRPSGNVGSTVVLDGDAFGDVQGAGKVLFSDGAGGTVASTIASPDDWANSFILTTVPSGAGTGPIAVQTATGTSDSLTFTVTQNATFSPSVVDWTQTTSLPAAVSGHAALAVPIDDGSGTIVQRVYVLGGAANDSVPVTDVEDATIQADGTLGAWSSATALPGGRAFHAAVAATPFNSHAGGSGRLYVLGGIDAKGGDPATTVLDAALAADGSGGSWGQSQPPLPVGLHSMGAVIFQSNLYVVGGAAAGDAASAAVYRAPIDTLGDLGTWQELTPLPAPRSYGQLTLIGNCLIELGGDSSAVVPDSPVPGTTRYGAIVRTRIDLRTDDLVSAGWTTDDTQPIKARAKHVSLVAGGGILQDAGLYNGIGALGASENTYAPVGASCDVGSFSGANNSSSIKSKGGANLFNHAAIAFVDASGAAHVMILGGDDVDSPGAKRAEVWVY
jgi:hypothetical protein